MAGGVRSGAGGNGDADANTADDAALDSDAGLRATAGAYADLIRVPNLFTAPPDVLLGASLVAADADSALPRSISVTSVAGLAVASVLLYAGGTTLNDAFDAPVDARERPERPIPSGRIPRQTAFALGVGLLLVAVGVAFAVAGVPAAVAAGLVAVAIGCYDGLLKGTAAGFLTMGATRGLNVVLGTTAAGAAVLELPPVALAVPAIVIVYIAAVTFMAARETDGGNRGAVTVAAVGSVAAVGGLAWYLAAVDPAPGAAGVALAFAVAFCWWVGRPLRAAYADPIPATVGPAVGACVLGLILFDAAVAAAAGIGWGIAAGAFLVPAAGLSRVFDVT
ncbi:UbiA family prenyltransferase [Natrinema salifodinae]|uniref:4-hydroxybenzoate polyprenyltransferase n=1 Tax=Natrinema salifodinae TaxID=1202768 RepID=A0A1I0MDR8_9EURY|nr:UbiA family prenyltransferase [Natrinema salifodinae]SEV85906.1 4-hydroxybenzoate polyprenyltransferase [Natrinema salifodinae]